MSALVRGGRGACTTCSRAARRGCVSAFVKATGAGWACTVRGTSGGASAAGWLGGARGCIKVAE